MAVLAEHTTRVVLDLDPPLELQVSEQRVTMDQEWVPYIQADLKCPLGDGAIAVVDPLVDDVWATVEVSRLLGRIDTLADLTRRYRGRPLSELSAEFTGDHVADVSASTYHDYETPGHPKRSQDRSWRLMLRSSVVDEKNATVSLELDSGEARLFDDAHMAGAAFRAPGATTRDKVNYVLARSGLGPTVTTWGMIPDSAIGDEALWQPGQTAWEFIQQLIRPAGGILWCDDEGDFWLGYGRPSLSTGIVGTPTTRTLHSAGVDRSVVNAVSKRSRDEGWYTAVLLTYTGGSSGPVYDFAYTPGVPHRVYKKTFDTIAPPPGWAAVMLAELTGRSGALELLAVSDYAPTPGDEIEFVSPRGTLTGRCTAVQWSHPTDEMSVRVRSVEES